MGAAIGAIGIMLLVIGMEWIASIPGAIKRRIKGWLEGRHYSREFRIDI